MVKKRDAPVSSVYLFFDFFERVYHGTFSYLCVHGTLSYQQRVRRRGAVAFDICARFTWRFAFKNRATNLFGVLFGKIAGENRCRASR